jgi:hypothetical protein
MRSKRKGERNVTGVRHGLWTAVALVALAACEPRVKIEPPDKPIVINLNIKIEQEVRVKVEKDVEEMFKKEGGLF